MILLFTDFGLQSPYSGEVKLALHRDAPEIPVLDLCADLAPFRPVEAGHLLAALSGEAPAGAVFLCVVDPGVGGPRQPVVLHAAGRWYVGPDNGLLDVVAGRAREARWFEITAWPSRLSATFHGRDLFAPMAAALACGRRPEENGAVPCSKPVVPAPDLAAVIYLDRYGNAMTGLRAANLPSAARLGVRGRTLQPARTFCDLPSGEAFWYENSSGLAELAVNQGSAQHALALAVGDAVQILGT